jgi:predicted AAA+ superfamily ATPase
MTSDKDTLTRVQSGLFHLQKVLSPYVAEHMKARFGERWLGYASRASGSGPLDPLDIYGLLKTVLDNWRDVFDASFVRNEKHKVRTFVSIAMEARNTTAHLAVPLKDAECLRYLDAMVGLARSLRGAKHETDALQALYDAQRMEGLPTTSVAPVQAPLSLALDAQALPVGALKPWIEVAFPQADVLGSRFKQSEFAADLAAVDMGKASEDYQLAENFFRITFLTEGLKRVLRTALERLTGKGGDPVLGLQTSFGGGKTHTMLALYHLANARDLSLLQGVADIAKDVGVTSWKPARRAVFVGTAKAVDDSLILDDGPQVRTLWGYLAWRLAGQQGLDIVMPAERAGTNPGSELIEKVLRLAGPSVILLDEVVAYARQLPDDRFEAFLSFIQSLTEAAKMVPGILLVGSLPESDTEAGGLKGLAALHRLERVFGRTGSPWLAAHGNETYEIVRRRLFQELDSEGEKARDATVRAFHELYKKNASEFPPHAKEQRYFDLLRLSYPIHPELFDRLSKDWSTIDKFQRTRGVLRLMANVISVLWSQRPNDPLILPARVPISDARVKAGVIYPLDAAFSAVVDSEVDGEGSLPARMEAVPNRRIGQARAATRAARAVFLCSAPTVGQSNAGVNGQGIRLAAAEPGDQLAIFGEALRELHEKANYLYEEAGRYWFSTKPTLNRLAEDRAAAFPEHEVDAEIVRILAQEASQKSSFSRVYAAPDDPTGIDEAPELSLVILGPSQAHSKGLKDGPAIEAVTNTLMRCRSSQRRYRNTLIFAAPDDGQLSNLRQVVRRAIAWANIQGDRTLQGQITQAQADDVKEKAKSGRESAEKAARSTWTHLLFAEKDPTVLDGKPFDISQTSLMSKDRSSITVSAYDKMSSRGDGIVKDTLGPTMLMAKLDAIWEPARPHLRFGEVKEWFASYPYLPKLRDASVLEAAIGQGVSNADPHFAFAEGWDEERGAYRGLIFRALIPQRLSDDGLIVRRSVAEATIAETAPTVAASLKTSSANLVVGSVISSGGLAADPASSSTVAPRKPRRFYGSVELDMVRPVKSFDAILNAVVMELQRTQGAKVKLTLEIEAEASDGFAEGEVSVVRDNARQLKFKSESTGFEE